MAKITFEELNNYLHSLYNESQGTRFMSVWDINTGEPNSKPKDLTFCYKKGDYFIITAHKKESKKEFSIYLPCGNHYPQKEEIKTNKLKEETYKYIYVGDNVWVKELMLESPIAILPIE